MTSVVENLRFTMNPEAVASIHDDGIVILHTGKGRLFTSNGTGACIWRALERGLPLEAIAAEICGQYQIDPGTALRHAMHFLNDLERHALVQRMRNEAGMAGDTRPLRAGAL